MAQDREPPTRRRRDRRRRLRPIGAILAALMALGLLGVAVSPFGVLPGLWSPASAPPSGPSDPLPPTPTPDPPGPPPKPPETPPKPTPDPPSPPPKPPEPPPQERSVLLANGSRTCPAIALTYDAGSAADGAAAILDVLQAHKIKATFFLTGKWVEQYPDLARRIAAEGHQIANHTYSHPDLTKLEPEAVLSEIRTGEETIRRVVGVETRPLMREPYGAFTDAERSLVYQAGFRYSVYWDVDTLDWQFPPLDVLVQRLTERPKNGSIVLMHLNVAESAEASDQAIPVLEAKGFRFVTISELIGCQ